MDFIHISIIQDSQDSWTTDMKDAHYDEENLIMCGFSGTCIFHNLSKLSLY